MTAIEEFENDVAVPVRIGAFVARVDRELDLDSRRELIKAGQPYRYVHPKPFPNGAMRAGVVLRPVELLPKYMRNDID